MNIRTDALSAISLAPGAGRRAAAPHHRTYPLLALALLMLCSSCMQIPFTGVTKLDFSSFGELERHLLSTRPAFEQFKLRGPFAVITHPNHEVQLSATERVTGDLYLAAHTGKSPLVILLHGNENSKDDHAYQALHLATWGMHSLSLEMPNKGPWSNHGQTLARLVDHIRKNPEDIDARIDPRKVILLGHSFGGSSMAFALGQGAPVVGGILLDPAAVGRNLVAFLGKIDKPVMVLGADEDIFQARGREYFYRHVPRNIAEISIWNADHDDAQFRLDTESGYENQVMFVGALTAAAFSLAATGNLDYVWSSFGDAIRAGRMIEPKRK